MKEDASLGFTQTGFMLLYFALMGALGLASFKHYDVIAVYILLPMGLIGSVVLAIGRFAPKDSITPY
jgi:hypothetical protein